MERRRHYAWLLWSPEHSLVEVTLHADCDGMVWLLVRPLTCPCSPGLELELGGPRGDVAVAAFDVGYPVPRPVRDDEVVNEALNVAESLLQASHVLAEHAEEEPCRG